MEEIVYFNGSLVPLNQAAISPLDYGFMHGYGLFETMRSYSGHVFRLYEHMDRLFKSAKLLGISLKPTASDFERAVHGVLDANGLSNARIRLTVSGGIGDITPNLGSCKAPTVVITAKDYSHQVQIEGFKAKISSIRRNTTSPLCSIKSLNSLDNLLAHSEAKLSGCNQAIMMNDEDFIAEGHSCNVFLVSDNVLITPDEHSGILPGITRRVVLDLAASLGICAIEQKVCLEELLHADEAFFTNSVIEIVALTHLDDRTIGEESVGKITKRLINAYKDLVKHSSK